MFENQCVYRCIGVCIGASVCVSVCVLVLVYVALRRSASFLEQKCGSHFVNALIFVRRQMKMLSML